VRRFVAATQLGWKHYVEDPALGNALILESNKHGMTREALEYGTSGLRKLALPESMALQELGQMSLERWTQLVQQMVELKLVDGAKIRAEDCFTNDFIVID
jgi:NitT/TauT family transport system substrate-binding protein